MMIRNILNNRRVIAALILCLAMSAPMLSFANASTRYREQLDQFRIMVEELAKLDTQNMAADDRADIVQWLEETEVFLARGDLDATGTRLKRIEYGLEMVRQITTVSQLQGQAQLQEQNFHSATEEVAKMKAEIEQLQAKKTELGQAIRALQ